MPRVLKSSGVLPVVSKAFAMPVLCIGLLRNRLGRVGRKGFFRGFKNGNFIMFLSTAKDFSDTLYRSVVVGLAHLMRIERRYRDGENPVA
jgi:hypothetical protein